MKKTIFLITVLFSFSTANAQNGDNKPVTIHAHYDVDLATSEHECGHYLYSELVGSFVYNVTVVPSSLYSAATDPNNHKYFWTEYVANWQAINFSELTQQ